MKLPPLVISAVRLSGRLVKEVAQDAEINRSLLSRCLSGAPDMPEKYLPALCAAVGLETNGQRWNDAFVGRWSLFPASKKGLSPTLRDLATAYAALKTPRVLRLRLESTPHSYADELRLAVAKALAHGNDESWCFYLVMGGSVRRLLYIDPLLREESESLLGSAGRLQPIEVDDVLDRHMGGIWGKISRIHRPAELDDFVKLIQSGGPKMNLTQKQIELIRQAAALGNQTPEELIHLFNNSLSSDRT